ncbi:MAG: DUF167 family protein [bacterium]|nr:DUF167 family protein [bacterium]
MYIKLHIVTSTKKESIKKDGQNSFVIAVKEKPERNMANRRVLEIVRDYFNLKAGDGPVRIVSGHHSPLKIVSIPDKNV